MRDRKPWAQDREHTVQLHSKWIGQAIGDRWNVVGLFRYELGHGREVLAVTIKCLQEGPDHWKVKHMSEARFRQIFVREK